ncbi:TRAP transporter large permease [Wolinella succinogenes]|uniref:LARGE INTEGRAL C4-DICARBOXYLATE MEMBRANE TRANSPORT PROTEIN,PUTATIVE n=2 Tax=Wolinella succinogenes TaxID=844 RepID=Q7M856_WOLSU|nr:TRAP transporter large permease subunit [Wolinella succinogenes]CAE10875.1 LARGE INTEGRAL C4-DICARBOXYLATE MEMBRANE TRANSPORT PROTEIN,PUTATIVE [Wolinella succinogenes]VEG81034.1 Neu5Ac permease [Wolinella succinogenes]HCZ18473.1 C4-dicarboxylate ABC transporter permease [Helicobacter sp.]
MSIAFLFIGLFGLMLIGVPVAVALGTSTVLSMLLFTELDPMSIPQLVFDGINKFSLMAIPMFILAGNLLSKGSSARRIIDFAKSMVGHLPGGLPMSAIFACIIFAAVSGSSPATVVAIGSIMFAAIKDAGYPASYAVGGITTAGSLGILIPPSIVMIVYGVTAEESIGKLFMAGVIPGLMIGAMMMLQTYWGAKRLGFKATEPAPFRERLQKLGKAFWALMVIFVVIGGIYGGIFTPTEAAAVSAVYAFVISYFVYKDIQLKDLYKVFLESAMTTSMIFFIIANAVVFAHFLTSEQIPQTIAQTILDHNVGKIGFLILVNIILFIMGQFMEPSSVVMIMVPLLLPIATELGIDPIHFGIIMVVNMELGMITPPVGLNLFVASGLTGMSLKDVVIASLPWTITIFIGLILVTYVPAISLWLPNLMFGTY